MPNGLLAVDAVVAGPVYIRAVATAANTPGHDVVIRGLQLPPLVTTTATSCIGMYTVLVDADNGCQRVGDKVTITAECGPKPLVGTRFRT